MEQNTNEINLREWILRILKNWYWFAISCTVCLVLGAWYYVSHTQQFRVDAHIMIRDNESGSAPQAEMLQMMGLGGTKKIDDEISILTSRDLLIQVVKTLDIQTECRKKVHLRWIGQYPVRDISVVYPPCFTDTTKRSVSISLKARKSDYVVKVKYGRGHRSRHVVASLDEPLLTAAGKLQLVPSCPIQPGSQYRIRTSGLLSMVAAHKKICTVAPIKKESNVVYLSTTTDIPKRSIDFINKQIELYNLDALVDKNLIASNTAKFIGERLELIESELSAAEADVERYKTSNHITDLASEAELFLKQGSTYRNQIAEVETQLNLVQFIQDFIRNNSKQYELIPANLGITDESLMSLINEYNTLLLQRMRVVRTATEDNPMMAQMNIQLNLMRENILTSIAGVMESLRIKRNDIQGLYGNIETQRNELPEHERLYVEVARKKALKERLYLFLYEKREENALTLASSVVPAKIIAKPQVDPNPVKPKLKIIAVICLFLGACAPIGCMILYDTINNTLPDESQGLQRKLSIPFGGTLIQNHHGGYQAVSVSENSASAELFRTLRTNLRFFLPASVQTPIILVTSCVNGEGKSYVAGNLAISLSLLGKKIALVGLDIRKPMLSTYFNLPSHGALTTYLSDDSYTIDDIIIPSHINNLDILPAGIIPPNPSELLQNERLDTLFDSLRTRYDYIIVDSAPIALVSDTYLLNRLSDMTIFVSRAHYTTWPMIDLINETNTQHRLNNMVCILNGVSAQTMGYGYGYGYGTNKKQ